MKKILFIALFLAISLSCSVQKKQYQQNKIATLTHKIDRAFIEMDTLTLSGILHDSLTLGHSNNWVETKSSLLKTLMKQDVQYTSMKRIGKPKIHYTSKKIITSRRNLDVKGTYKKTRFDVKLNILEIWIFDEHRWQLLARQSVNRID